MKDDTTRRQIFAEAYGAGDIMVGKITGQYPNAPAFKPVDILGLVARHKQETR